jgi:hypothetical protein
VKNLLIPISIGVMCTSFTIAPVTSSNHPAKVLSYTSGYIHHNSVDNNTENSILYNAINLSKYGLGADAFNYAYQGYKKMLTKKAISKNNYLTICDFSQPSSKKRFYIIDLVNKKLVTNTYVAHGKNSGNDYATKFSNVPESLQTSLGFYTTAQTYIGDHGLSLRLVGVDAGFNDNAYTRSIVLHGATYVDAARVKAGIMMGRSFGCPAVPQNESIKIINTIKNGSCLFIYNATDNYLTRSKILND